MTFIPATPSDFNASPSERVHLPKTLLITSSRPGIGSVGELFLGSLCKLFQPGELFCYSAVSTAYDVPVADEQLAWLPMKVRQLPGEYACQYNEKFFASLWRKFYHLELLESALEPFVEDACKIISENQIKLLWLVLNSPSALLIAAKVLDRTGLPATAIVWDPIGHIAKQGKVDKRTAELLEEHSTKVIAQLRSCGVASQSMKELFAKLRPELDTRVLINTPPAFLFTESQTEKNYIRISFSGSLYARNEFSGLITALNSMKWNLDGKKIELHVFSYAFDLPIHSGGGPTNLVLRGYLPEKELLTELADSDVAYLPYWFAEEYAEGVKRCFPAKLATYIAAGCPVLYHGPKLSSPTEFLLKYKVGKSVHGFDPVKFKDALLYLTKDEEFKREYQNQRQRSLAEELGNDLFQNRFLELIQIAMNTKEGAK